MTYQLASLRLRSIGERSARFSDCTISTTGADGTPQDHIVWLRNGGGKSSLLSLFYALLLPKKYDFMGRAADRVLTDYVDATDTSHTIAVWHPATTGPTTLDGAPERVLVTGAVYEWKDLRRPAHASRDSDDLGQSFYAFFTVPGVLDETTLPVTDDTGRPLRRNAYIAQLREMAAAHSGAVDLTAIDKNYGDWERALVERGLDPELFRSQKKMNHVEGGVENLFAFRTAREFINFLLDLTVSPTVTDRITEGVGQIAGKIAQKPAILTERRFCQSAAEGLDQLAKVHAEQVEVTAQVEAAAQEAMILSAQFSATIEAASSRRTAIEKEIEQHITDRARHNTARAESISRAFLYRERAAALRLQEAQEQYDCAERTRSQSHRTVSVWRAAEAVAAHRDVAEQLSRARAEAVAEAQELAPLAAEHDHHASAYKVLLGVLAADAEARAATVRCEAEEAEAEAGEQEKLAEQTRSAADTAAREADRCQLLLEQFDAQLREAVAHGALPDATADPISHAELLGTDRARLEKRLGLIREHRAQRPAVQARLDRQHLALSGERAQVELERARLIIQRQEHAQTATRLAGTDRVITLVEASTESPVDVWADAETLLHALDREIQRADAEGLAEEVSQADTDRILAAHTATGFLPTTVDAEKIERILTHAGIDVESGWSHLRSVLADDQLPEALRDPALTRIGAGLVVPTEQAQVARNALSAAGETTVALVSVFTAATITDVVTAPSGQDPVVWSALAPGLLDKDAAESEVAALEAASRDHAARSAARTDQRAADHALRQEVSGFLAACPAGHLAVLDQQVAALDAQHQELCERIEANDQERQALADAEQADVLTETEHADRLRALDESLIRLEPLTEAAAQRRQWESDRDTARFRHRALTADFDRHRRAVQEATGRGQSLELIAVGHDWTATGYRDQAGEIAFLGTSPPVPTVGNVAGEDLESLRRRTADARRAYELPASQQQAAGRAAQLAQQLPILDAQLPTDPDLRTDAEAALATPEGQSRHNRATALAAAEEARSEADKHVGQAHSVLTAATTQFEDISAQRPDLTRRPTPIEPSSATEAAELAQQQEAETARLRDLVSGAEATIGELEQQDGALQQQSTTLRLLASALPHPVATTTIIEPFTGSLATAETAKDEVLEALHKAQNQASALAQRISERVGALRLTASEYPTVPVKARDRLRFDTAEQLSFQAEDLTHGLRLRIRHIDADLASIAADQAIITQSLAAVVADNFEMFRRTQRFSALPEGLGGLSGKQLIKIKPQSVAEEDLRSHVGQVIEEAIAKGNKPEGMELLKASTHAAVGARGFTVKVLKPVHDLTPLEEDIAALGKWSGGERLTAGVALYCTIAKVRAVNAGHKDRFGGMLVLDNPIGRASHGPLIALQRKVAAAQGVQLIYATGVKDFDAVSHFPGITRLENRSAVSGRRKFVVAAEDEPVEAISGARIVRPDRLDHSLHP